MFSKDRISELAIKKLNYYIIELIESKKLFYGFLYFLFKKELKLLYKYFNEYLAKN